MRSYDNIVKIEEIRKKVEEGDITSAQKILDTMDIKKIKNISDLNLMAEVFSENERYEEATELYIKIFEKSKTRRIIYKLVDISIKKLNVEEAEEYFTLYQRIVPEDFDGYILRYKIDKIKGASYDQLIDTLEALKKIEYTEKWAYELAKLYYKAGMANECFRECSDIVLWFGEGAYVEKAKMLRSYYSGETDKNKIMEELKRRSEMVNNDESQDESADSGNEENNLPESELSNDLEEEIISGTDFMAEHEEEEFEYGLKRDIQDILTDDAGEQTQDGKQLEAEQTKGIDQGI